MNISNLLFYSSSPGVLRCRDGSFSCSYYVGAKEYSVVLCVLLLFLSTTAGILSSLGRLLVVILSARRGLFARRLLLIRSRRRGYSRWNKGNHNLVSFWNLMPGSFHSLDGCQDGSFAGSPASKYRRWSGSFGCLFAGASFLFSHGLFLFGSCLGRFTGLSVHFAFNFHGIGLAVLLNATSSVELCGSFGFSLGDGSGRSTDGLFLGT